MLNFRLKMINKKLTYIIFFCSGISGLIYELLWSHYLKTFLGHSAYAQSLVLCIFMGGMAVGSYLSCFVVKKVKNLFLWYGVIEGLLGVFALSFHYMFLLLLDFSYNAVINNISNTYAVIFYKVFISSLIIFPQTVLLGMTFPLISNHLIRGEPENTSKSVSLLYFCNSLGAAFGVFISGFYLVEYLGMPMTMGIGGVINLLIFLIVLFSARKVQYFSDKVGEKLIIVNKDRKLIFWLLFVSFATSFSSFIYEIVWIRMLSIVLGSSIHNFEIMLCTFITGIAFGSLYIRWKADKIKDELSYLSIVQVLMGIAAIITLPLYNFSFYFVSFLVKNLPKTDFGYYVYNLSGQLISFAVMLPATFLAGMTFPLLSYMIFKQGYKDEAVGYNYAVNTLGGIFGVIFAVNIGLPFLGIKNLLFFGAIIDITLGVLIMRIYQRKDAMAISPKYVVGSATSCVLTFFLLFNMDFYKLASGVYRDGTIFNSREYNLKFYKDGKTSSISVISDGDYLSIRTNGKSDSAIATNEKIPPSPDEYTASLAALIPYFYNPVPERVAVIGLGTGLTSHVALLNPNTKEVDTIEIEEKVLDGAKFFMPRNELVFNDKRSKIYVDDAKTFFSNHKKLYDIIISEPSNPWISGVSGLFSKEFYSHVKKYLKTNGILIQWLQLYEIDLPHIASIVKALSNSFDEYVFYITTENELLILSGNDSLGCLRDEIFKIPQMKSVLKRLNITSVNDVTVRRLGDKTVLDTFFKVFDINENSDYDPIIERKGAKMRFLGAGAGDLLTLAGGPFPVFELLYNKDIWYEKDVNISPFFQKPYQIKLAYEVKELIINGKVSSTLPINFVANVRRLNNFFEGRDTIISHYERLTIIFDIFCFLLPHLKTEDINILINKYEKSRNYAKLTEVEKLWLKLFSAINNRNYLTMTIIAANLIEKDKNIPPVAEEYLLAVYVAGNIAQNNLEKVRTLFANSSKLGVLREQNVVFKYLDHSCR